jgi:hypothetical protein
VSDDVPPPPEEVLPLDGTSLLSLLAEVEAALSEVNVILDQHSRAAKARAFAALKEAQYEAAKWAERIVERER